MKKLLILVVLLAQSVCAAKTQTQYYKNGVLKKVVAINLVDAYGTADKYCPDGKLQHSSTSTFKDISTEHMYEGWAYHATECGDKAAEMFTLYRSGKPVISIRYYIYKNRTFRAVQLYDANGKVVSNKVYRSGKYVFSLPSK